MSTCITCRRPFHNYGQQWRTYCSACYSQRKRTEELHENGEIERAYLAGYTTGKRDGLALSVRFTPDADLVRRCIRLTHPDRHPAERADEANSVTASLLNLVRGGER